MYPYTIKLICKAALCFPYRSIAKMDFINSVCSKTIFQSPSNRLELFMHLPYIASANTPDAIWRI